MLIFIETGKPDLFVKSVGQSVKTNNLKIDYTPSKLAKSKAARVAKNSDPEVQKQMDLIKKKISAA
jgi:hypothetical protein